MPIDQDRMMAVIMAGINYKAAYEDLINRMRKHRANIVNHPEWLILPSDIRDELLPTAALEALPFPTAIQDAVLLQTEYLHFVRNSKDNKRRAEYMQRKRFEKGTPRKSTTITKITPYEPMKKEKPIIEDPDALLREQWEAAQAFKRQHQKPDQPEQDEE